MVILQNILNFTTSLHVYNEMHYYVYLYFISIKPIFIAFMVANICIFIKYIFHMELAELLVF